MPVSPAELFDQHHLAIFRYALRMTGRADVAEDLTQEVFVRVVRGWVTYDARDKERAWLFRIARNLVTDWRRATSRAPVEQAGAVEPALDSNPDLALAVQQALDGLPVDDRDAFLLRTLGGFGHEEIAALIGTSPAAARSRIFRARAALRCRLLGAHSAESIKSKRVTS